MRRTLAALCVLSAAVGLAVGSGGFSSVNAERTTEVAVVGDEHAFLGIADKLQCGAGKGNGQNRDAIMNRFPGTTLDITVKATIPESETGKLRIGPKGEIEPVGPEKSTEFELNGIDSGTSATIQVVKPTGNVPAAETIVFEQVRASGTGVSVTADDRHVDVDCPAANGDKGSTQTESAD